MIQITSVVFLDEILTWKVCTENIGKKLTSSLFTDQLYLLLILHFILILHNFIKIDSQTFIQFFEGFKFTLLPYLLILILQEV